jgi:hypothetical protein
MTSVEILWGWTEFILNVVLILSSLKIVYDIHNYVKKSDRRFRSLYFKVCEAGAKLHLYSTKSEHKKFQHMAAELLKLNPEVENPFTDTAYEYAYKEFDYVKKHYNTYSWKILP